MYAETSVLYFEPVSIQLQILKKLRQIAIDVSQNLETSSIERLVLVFFKLHQRGLNSQQRTKILANITLNKSVRSYSRTIRFSSPNTEPHKFRVSR